MSESTDDLRDARNKSSLSREPHGDSGHMQSEALGGAMEDRMSTWVAVIGLGLVLGLVAAATATARPNDAVVCQAFEDGAPAEERAAWMGQRLAEGRSEFFVWGGTPYVCAW
ncbi:MAG: hypothetical protein EP330_15605 [Deltaproteobacteria bacterium]|nr:MAG: hypothetical protein EP330_15605 [Deltaproteobacteria bacterium]